MVELCAVEVDTWSKDNPPPLDEDGAVGNDNMLDTYTLVDVVINLSIDDESVGWIDSDELASFSGTLDLQESTIAATVTIEGETETISGSYTRTIESPHTGVFHIDDTSESYDLNYSTGLEWCDQSGCTRMLNLHLAEPVCEMVAW
jgi:hypothetical protein